MGENGLVSSQLVFGDLALLPILDSSLPEQKERPAATKTAQADMNSMVAEGRISKALNRKIAHVSNRCFKVARILKFSQKHKKMDQTI